MFFRVARDQRIQELLKIYCEKKNYVYSEVSFIHNGDRIQPTQTLIQVISSSIFLPVVFRVMIEYFDVFVILITTNFDIILFNYFTKYIFFSIRGSNTMNLVAKHN